MSCYVTIQGTSYTKEEFLQKVKEEGMSIFPSPETKLARSIMFKYDYKNAEPSIMEVVYKMLSTSPKEYPTKADIDSTIYKSAAFADYSVQKNIHHNTYSGLKITGISANFGKSLAYLFDSTKVTKVQSPSGEVIELYGVTDGVSNLNRLLTQYSSNSVADLVSRKGFKIVEREAVKTKAVLRIGDKVLDKFSRDELDLETLEPAKSLYLPNTVNIFETIDTIINLAIDNVKEMKLFVLGITNANANSFLSALAFGIPLPTVTKMFRSDIYSQYSSRRRIFPEAVKEDMVSMVQQLFENQDQYDKASVSDYSHALARALFDKNSTLDTVLEKASKLQVKLEYLDNPPTGVQKILHEIAMLNNLLTLLKVGDELFVYSQLFSTLRAVKGKKWSADYVLRRVEELTNFPSFSVADSNKFYVEQLLENFKQTSIPYQTAIKDANMELAQDLLDKEEDFIKNNASKYWKADAKQMRNAALTNALVSRTINKDFTPSEFSVFANASPLTIPHVFSAYSILYKFKRMVEGAFAVHNPLVRNFVKNVKASMQVTSSYAVEKDNEFMQDEFIKFLSSSSTLTVGEHTIDLTVKDVPPRYIGDNVITGVDAWAIGIAEKVGRYKEKSNNAFITEIEVVNNYLGIPRLLITSDKDSDPESLERIRQGMSDLFDLDPEFALELFKYAVLTQGLGFGRTSFSKIFPDIFLAQFSKNLEDRINSVMPRNERGEIKTPLAALNLSRLEAVFSFQFLRNYPSKIKYIRNLKRDETGQYKNYYGTMSKIYSGKDRVDSKEIYFDARFKADESTAFHDMINVYDEVYAKIYTSDDYVYYRKIPVNQNNKLYYFSEQFIDSEFSLKNILDPTYGVEDSALDDKYTNFSTRYRYQKYQEGDKVALVDFASPFPESVKVVTVSSVKQTGKNFSYSYTNPTVISTQLPPSDVESKVILSNYILQGQSRVNVIESSRGAAIARAGKKRNSTLAIVSDYIPMTRNYSNIVVLPLNELSTELSETQLSEKVAEVVRVINESVSLPNIVIEESILNILNSIYPKAAYDIAVALNAKFGITLDIATSKIADADLDKYAEYIREVKRKRILNRSFKRNSVSVKNGKFYLLDVKRKISPGTLLETPSTTSPLPYAYVVSQEPTRLEILPFDDAVLDVLEYPTYSLEEIKSIIDSLNKC